MAARLPDSLSMSAPRGRRPGPPEDLRALSQGVNAALEGAGAMFARKADAEASDALMEFQTGFQAGAAERAAAYDGSAPGFAQAEAERFETELKAFEQTRVGRSARGAFRQRGDEAKAAYVGRAIAVEGNARAAVVAERREADDRGVLTKAEMLLQTEQQAALKPLYDDGDVNDPGFIDSIMGARAATAAKVRETLPERLRPRWDAAIAAGDAKAQAQALSFREQRQEEKLVANTKEILTLGSNQLLDNPDGYEATRTLVLGSLDPFPQAEEAELRPKVESQLAVAYFQGLAAQDRRDEAKALLKSGKFDTIIDPDTKARLMGSLDRKTVADAMREQEVAEAARSDVASTIVSGKGGRTSTAEIAAELGPDQAAAQQYKLSAAQKLHDLTGPLSELSNAGIQEAVRESLPTTLSATYATDLEIHEEFKKQAAAELERRTLDPAAWAMSGGLTEGGQSSVPDQIQAKFNAWTAADPKNKQAAAQDYARTITARQRLAGIPEGQIRVLPKSVTSAWAAGSNSEDPKTRRENMELIGRAMVQFGPYRGKVRAELLAAGVSPTDMEAAATAAETGDAGHLASYLFGSQQAGAGKSIGGDKEKALLAGVDKALRPYLASLEPVDPDGKRSAAIRESVLIDARGRVLRGTPPVEAIETAAKRYDRYSYQGRIRLPKAIEADKAYVGSGASKVLKAITATEGKYLTEPVDPNTGKPIPDAAYAATVRQRGIWVTLPDDSGVVLMIPMPNGTKAVLDDKGQRITRRWDELIKRGKDKAGAQVSFRGRG